MGFLIYLVNSKNIYPNIFCGIVKAISCKDKMFQGCSFSSTNTLLFSDLGDWKQNISGSWIVNWRKQNISVNIDFEKLWRAFVHIFKFPIQNLMYFRNVCLWLHSLKMRNCTLGVMELESRLKWQNQNTGITASHEFGLQLHLKSTDGIAMEVQKLLINKGFTLTRQGRKHSHVLYTLCNRSKIKCVVLHLVWLTGHSIFAQSHQIHFFRYTCSTAP